MVNKHLCSIKPSNQTEQQQTNNEPDQVIIIN